MEYTVQELADMAGISGRTLRYYDEIGILKPKGRNASGYRVYGEVQVDELQQILFYRELGMSLEQIRDTITDPAFDGLKALREHRARLLDKREHIERLIDNVDRSIAAKEGRVHMSSEEKFEGFKRRLIDENEKKYGKEVRARYGDEAVERSNQAFRQMTAEQYAEFEQLGAQVIETLKEAFATGDPSSELAQKTADLHRQWLTYAWGRYDKEAHAGLAQMYVDDERFTAFYDQYQPGATEFLRAAILIYTDVKSQ